MSKRNVILLIIILVLLAGGFLGYLYTHQPAAPTTGDTGGTNFFANFNPFGKRTVTTPTGQNPADVSGYTPGNTQGAQYGKLKKISSMPVAGYGLFAKERYKEFTAPAPVADTTTPTAAVTPVAPSTEFATAVRYVAQATGNIYETFADNLDERRFSTITVPKVHEAYFGNGGQSVVMRYLKADNKTIATYIGALPKELLGGDTVSIDQVNGNFLPDNITDVSISSDTSKIFYLFNSGENTIGTTAGVLGDAKTQVFDSPFNEWLTQWPNTSVITLTTKPSGGVPGYMYAVNPVKKDFNKILGGINGLTTLTAPDGKSVLYGDNNLNLVVYNTDTGNTMPIGVKTLPEKCVWDSGSHALFCAVPRNIDQALYPDSWYMGEASFSDQIWEIDTDTGATTMVLDPMSIENGEDMDAIKLDLDSNENYLFFINKKDSTLWEFNLK